MDDSAGYMLAFPYYGGKFSHLKWLLPLLPTTRHYCEPYGGAGSVLINRRPSQIETYNDIDGEIVNFFQVLRENPKDLIRLIDLTPYSRKELEKSLDIDDSLSSLERARRFFVKAKQTSGGNCQTSSIGRWGFVVNHSRRGMAQRVSAWLSHEDLEKIALRLIRVQIENDAAITVIERYDSPDTLFYCDPPYPLESRGGSAYKHEMNHSDYLKLSELLHSIQGKAAISGYECEIMRELFGDWYIIKNDPKTTVVNRGRGDDTLKTEILWTNYDPSICKFQPIVKGQARLF